MLITNRLSDVILDVMITLTLQADFVSIAMDILDCKSRVSLLHSVKKEPKQSAKEPIPAPGTGL